MSAFLQWPWQDSDDIPEPTDDTQPPEFAELVAHGYDGDTRAQRQEDR